MVNEDCQQKRFNEQVRLSEIQSGSRTIAFSTAGIQGGTPVLFWYPAGGNRRILVSYHDAAVIASLSLICVNRPGMGGTSPTTKGSGPAEQAATASSDAASVLDSLGVHRVGLLFMCAGAPFALAFASRYPDRLSGRLLGIAPYVLPADCDASKTLERFGACHCPTWLSSHVAAGVTSSIIGSFSSLPRSLIISRTTRTLSPEEREIFEDAVDEEDFVRTMSWVFEETGSRTADYSVLMSRGEDLGINYGKMNGTLTVFHGDNDKVALFGTGEWLTKQIVHSELKRLPGGSHEGALFLVHPDVKDALALFQE